MSLHNTGNYTIMKDTVHVIMSNGKPVAIVFKDREAHHDLFFKVDEMHGDEVGLLLENMLRKTETNQDEE